jgi:hypothetical protein
MSTSTAVAASIVALSAVALVLALLVFRRYRAERRVCHLYWGAGLLLVVVVLAEEAALYVGVWNQPLIQTYLIVAALLVGVLSLGSAMLALAGRWRTAYFGYIGVTSAALVLVGLLTPVPTSIMSAGVVSGLPPTSIDVLSSLITFPAAVLLIVSSLYAAIKQPRPSFLYITAGAVVFSAAGTLYIVSFPVTLYYSDFLGVLLLFLGFVQIPRLSAPPAAQPQATS